MEITCIHAPRFAFPSADFTHSHSHSLAHPPPSSPHLRPAPLILITLRLRDIEAQAIRVKVDLIARVLQNLCNVAGVLKLPEIDVRAALLDGVADELGGAGLTLGADDGGLLLLAGFVDDERGALGFLLGDLLGFDGGGEFGGEGEVLRGISM